jgi:DNA-binding response OmpR family regulator
MTDTKFILVVEDDPVLKNLLGHTLAGKYQTLYASDGNEAIALFEQYKPSLVLLDLMLPTMDGFAVLESIRKHTDASGQTPVIVVSNLGQQKDMDRAKALGANDYLIKAEVPIEDIVTKIEGMLGVSTSAPVTPPIPASTPTGPGLE